MKRILLTAAVFALTATAFAQKKIADVARFTTETIEFGKIKQGVPQKGTFTVTNIGTEPLIIEQANPTCGCTISDYTKEPIAPGKTGFINATYNAAAAGHFEKHLTVKFAGIDEMKSITFVGDVVAGEQAEKAKAEEAEKLKSEKDAALGEKAAPTSVTAAKASSATSSTLKRAPAKTATKKLVKQ